MSKQFEIVSDGGRVAGAAAGDGRLADTASHDARRPHRFGYALLLTGVMLAATWLVGCNTQPPPAYQENLLVQQHNADQTRDDFSQAISFLDRFGEFEPGAVRHQILHRLNQWIARQQEDPDWELDPLVEGLHERFQPIVKSANPSRMQFDMYDVFYLQEMIYLRDIARQTATRPLDDPALAEWIERQQQVVGEESAQDLALSYQLFDWTVRNIQLIPTPPQFRQKKKVAGPAAPGQEAPEQAVDQQWPQQAGPGQRWLTWQTLLIGRGDRMDRARVFMLLARQQGIPAVMIGLADEDFVQPRWWLPAVMVRDECYLFDTGLGLPQPGPGGAGVATLSQVRADPELLRELNIEGGPDYPLQSTDIRRVVALIDADPRALAQRMARVEKRLAGDDRFVLTVAPSQWVERLKACGGVDRVGLWTAPFGCLLHRELIAGNQQAAVELAHSLQLIEHPPLYKGRMLHFRGDFNNREEEPGAKSMYLACRPSNKLIDQLDTPGAVQRQFGFDKLMANQRGQQLDLMRQRKIAASFWLGLVEYEEQQWGVAQDYLRVRTLDADPSGPWSDGARYNLARTLEHTGQHEAARQLFLDDTSPQRHGNLLRAARLPGPLSDDNQSGEPQTSETQPSESQPSESQSSEFQPSDDSSVAVESG